MSTMTTPTREQVIEWADQAGITSDDAACQIHDLMRLCALAYTAGRAQGLREAAERARSEGITGISADDDEIVADWLEAAAIEQLRGE